jgi:branched-chain amino acid transport system substrate-binding protein
MKKRILAAVLMAAMLLVTATGCASGGDGSIVIGGLAPLTGNNSIYGIAANNGVSMAFEELNAKGAKIKYVAYDEKDDATEAVNAYNKLVSNDKIVALVGDVTSKPCLAVAQQAAKDNLPMITATGTAAEITQAGDNVFRACFIDPFQGEVMASYAVNKLGAKTAAILYDVSDDYSLGLSEAFERTAQELNLEVVATEGYNKGDIDFKAQLTNIAALNPDVLFIPVYYEDVALIVAQAAEIGVKATYLGADGWDGVLKKVDASNVAALNGAYFCGHYSSQSDDPELVAFVENYTQKYGEEPNMFAALGYDAANMLYAAIEKAGSTDSAAIIEQLKNLEYEGITGSMTFDENRNPIKSAAIHNINDGVASFVEYYDK